MHNIKHVLFLGLALLVAVGTFQGCSGDKGPAGPQGEQGPKGEVGPAGDDGSVMLSGKGKPKDSNGNNGDYFLNTKTGGLFGPKESGSWDSSPIIVLKGKDGADGKDGSQILSGTTAPGSSDGNVGDFYLNKSNYKLYGPKTNSGWPSPINLKGADGNANVTRYIFPGHDFSTSHNLQRSIYNFSNQEMKQSAWSVYLVNSHTYSGPLYFSIPGKARVTRYDIDHFYSSGLTTFEIFSKNDGTLFDRIEIVRIAANNTVDNTKIAPGAIIPEDLNTDNYQEVADYYGFGSN